MTAGNLIIFSSAANTFLINKFYRYWQGAGRRSWTSHIFFCRSKRGWAKDGGNSSNKLSMRCTFCTQSCFINRACGRWERIRLTEIVCLCVSGGVCSLSFMSSACLCVYCSMHVHAGPARAPLQACVGTHADLLLHLWRSTELLFCSHIVLISFGFSPSQTHAHRQKATFWCGAQIWNA